MWIEQVFIERFGLCDGWSIPDLTPGLTLLIGPNEAGKSSVLEFIRSVFFGFRTRNPRVNTYEPPDGTARSGWLKVRLASGELLRIQRVERPGTKEGTLTVWDESENSVAPSIVPLFRPGMDRKLYENLFAFDLDKMRHLDKQTLRGRIVSAVLGSLDVNPLDVARKLDERIKLLGKRSKRDPEALCAIQSKIDELNKRLKTLAQKPALYARLRADLDAVETRRNKMAAEIEDADRLLQQLTLIVRYEKEWKRLVALDKELAELVDVAAFPADGVSRLDRILDRKRETQEAVAHREQDLARVLERLHHTVPNRLLLENSDRIHALARQARGLSERPAAMEELRAALGQANTRLDQELSELGRGWTRVTLTDSDPSLILEQRIRSFADSWQSYRERIRDVETRARESADALERLEQKIALKVQELRSNAPYCRGFLEPKARDRLLEWKECGKRIADLQEKLGEKKRRMDILAGERHHLTSKLKDVERDHVPPIPDGFFWFILIIWGTAGTCMGSSAYLSTDARAFAFLAVGLLMLGLLPVAVMWKIRGDRGRTERIARERDALRRTLDDKIKETIDIETTRREFMHTIHQLNRQAQEIAAAVLGNPSAGLQEVIRAERRSSAAEEPVRRARLFEENIKELENEKELERRRNTQIRKFVDLIHEEWAGVKTHWQQVLRDEAFDPSLEPEPALELVRRLRDMKGKERAIVERHTTLAAMEKEWDAFARAVGGLAEDLEIPAAVGSPLDLVDHWARAEMESRELLTQQRELEEQVRDHQSRLGVLGRKIQDAADQARALMAAAGVYDEESFRSQALRRQRQESLSEERRVLLENMVAGLQCPDEDTLHERMRGQDWDTHKATIAMLQGKLQRLRAEIEDLAAQNGRFRRELETMEAEEETEQLLAEREEWLARLKNGVEEWLRFRLARGLVEKTLQVYETEKQPKVLEKSSGFFRSIAGDSFSRILLPMDRDQVTIERHTGSRVLEEHLSRGTLEQVYLSLRLAHVHVYHRGETAFPLMMDDVLVNFDPVRARSTRSNSGRFFPTGRSADTVLYLSPGHC